MTCSSSKAFFRSGVAPKLVERFASPSSSRSVEIWITTCIVANFGKQQQQQETVPPANRNNDSKNNTVWILINPSNPNLSGCKNFPYFPRGGPLPREPPKTMHKDWQPLGFVSTWGGMEVGTGMMYSVSVIDGLVHIHGGWKLQAELQLWKRLGIGNQDELCPVGTAVETSSGGEPLNLFYDRIVHTTPPFYKYDPDPNLKLAQCYQSALQLSTGISTSISNSDGELRIALPLLGSGCRGFPYDVACDIAAESVVSWMLEEKDDAEEASPKVTLAFALLELSIANQLIDAFRKHLDCITR